MSCASVRTIFNQYKVLDVQYVWECGLEHTPIVYIQNNTLTATDIISDNCSTPAVNNHLAVHISLEASRVGEGNSMSFPEWNRVSSLAPLVLPKYTSVFILVHPQREGVKLNSDRWPAAPGLWSFSLRPKGHKSVVGRISLTQTLSESIKALLLNLLTLLAEK